MPPRRPTKPRQPVVLPEDDDAYVREETVLAMYPVGATTLWQSIKDGRFPKPVKLSPRVNAWRVGTLRAKLASFTDD